MPFPFRFSEESIRGILFRYDRFTRTVEQGYGTDENSFKWETERKDNELKRSVEDIKETLEAKKREREYREREREIRDTQRGVR